MLGADVRHPEDALTIAQRARSLGFNSTVGILHDGSGQTRPLPLTQIETYQQIRKLESSVFSFSHFDRFQTNLVQGQPNDWKCRAGSRFLYICEDGLVHYCSQQRGSFQPPFLLKAASWAFVDNPGAQALSRAAAALLKTKS